MVTNIRISDPDNIDISVETMMTLDEWRKIRDALESAGKEEGGTSSSPLYGLWLHLDETIKDLESQYITKYTQE